MSAPHAKTLRVVRLGRVEYEDGLQLQRLFAKARALGEMGDALLLLEHPPVLTLGRGAKRENILADEAQLRELGVEVFETDRGGDVTYHGPGQLVGYPIFLLPPERHDVRRYVRDVEAALVETLAAYGLTAKGIPKWPGVWMGEEGRNARKIAAIGVHISRWLTTHGFALNVQPNLRHFEFIVPCGIREAGVTSMERELGRRLSLLEVENTCGASFERVFEAELVPGPALERTVSVVVLRSDAAGDVVLLLKRTEARGGFWQTVTGRCEEGEGAPDAARRELLEETGQLLEPVALDYVHAFALGGTLPLRLVQETAFAVRWPAEVEVRISGEHEAMEWVPFERARERLPFAGLRAALTRAQRALSDPAA